MSHTSDSFSLLHRAAMRAGMRFLAVERMGGEPVHGSVLLIANHASYVDWAAVQLASQRPVRFVALASFFRRWWSAWFLRAFGTIPIEPAKAVGSLKAVIAALQRGECVCLFAEGEISRHGRLLPLREGFRTACTRAPAPVQPVWIEGLWGGRWSFFGGRLWGPNRPTAGVVIVAFGQPIAPECATAESVRASLEECGAAAFARRMNLEGGNAARTARSRLSRSPGRRVVARVGPEAPARTAADILLLAGEMERRLLRDSAMKPACLLPHGPARMAFELACGALDRPLLALEPGLPADVMQRLVADTGCDALYTTPASRRPDRLPDCGVPVHALGTETGVLRTLGLAGRWMQLRFLPSLRVGRKSQAPGSDGSHWSLPTVLCTQLLLSGMATGCWLIMPGSAPGWMAAWLPLLTPVTLAPLQPGGETGWLAANLNRTGSDTLVASAPQLVDWMERGEPLDRTPLKRILCLDPLLTTSDAERARTFWRLPLLRGWCEPRSGWILTLEVPDPPTPFSTSRAQPGSSSGSVGRPLAGIALRTLPNDRRDVDGTGELELLAPALGVHTWVSAGTTGRITADGFVHLD